MIIREEEILEYSNPENKWIKLYFDKVVFPNGEKGRYNRIVEGDGQGSVAIIALSDSSSIGLVKIYRYPVDAWLWELPRGMCEASLTLVENARRELVEETGFDAGKIEELGRFFPNSAIITVEVAVVVARDLIQSNSVLDADSGAISETRFFDAATVNEMALKGEIRDGLTLAALHLARIHGIWGL